MSAEAINDATQAGARTALSDLIWEVSTYVEGMGEDALRDTPLTLATAGMLCLVHQEPGITLAEISRRVPKSAQALGQTASRLRKLELIERRLGDGPGIGLHATDAGRELAEVASARESGVADQLRELLGARRYELLTELLIESRDLLKRSGGARPDG